jgi:hypothetical protein
MLIEIFLSHPEMMAMNSRKDGKRQEGMAHSY